jgi:hypothetical protein
MIEKCPCEEKRFRVLKLESNQTRG